MVKITLSGKAVEQSGGLVNFMQDLTKAINRAINRSVEAESRKLAKTVVRTFENQALPLPALNADYKKQKIKQGFDRRIGFRTKSMVKAIKFFKNSKRKFFVGVRRQNALGRAKTVQKTAIPKYARYFEFGTPKQPPRAVYTPLLKASLPKYSRTIKREIRVAIHDVVTIWGWI